MIQPKNKAISANIPLPIFCHTSKIQISIKIYAIKYKQHITKNLMECFNS